MMKTLKATTLLVFLLVASNVFGQLKVVRFGMKGGVNLPQQTLVSTTSTASLTTRLTTFQTFKRNLATGLILV